MERRYIVYITLCLILGSILRFHNIGKYGLIGDELYAFSVASFVAQEGAEQQEAFRKPDSPYFTNIETHAEKGLSNFVTAVARRDNGSAALHTFALHYWIKVFGISDASLRSFSALFNILLLGFLFYFVIRHFKSKELALLSVFLATISPFYITFSQVARSYSMLFFWALLATHLLLILVERKKFSWLLVAYGVTCFFLLMSHYSSFVLLGFHAVYVFVYFRKPATIFKLALAAIIPLLGLVLWLNSPGGQWAFHAISHSKDTYLQEAVTYNDDFIQLTSLRNVVAQLSKVSGMSFLPIEVVYEYVSGIKNWAFTLLHTILVVLVIRSSRKAWEKLIAMMLLAITLSFLVSINYLAFIEVSYTIVLIIWFLFDEKWRLLSPRKFLIWIFPVSLFFLGVFAYMDGNTFRMMPRYSGYAYVFGIIFWAAVFLHTWRSKNVVIKTVLSVQSILFVYYWIISIGNLYHDDQIRYFHNLSEERMENPYALIAQKIEDNYMEGDTVIFPSLSFHSTDPGYDMPAYSVQDAQYVNLYLRATKPVIIQRVDTTVMNKVFIKSAGGQKQLIFDFENGRFRY